MAVNINSVKSNKTSAISKQFEKNLEMKKIRELIDDLDKKKRDLNKLLGKHPTDSMGDNASEALVTDFVRLYKEVDALILKFGDEQTDFAARLKFHGTFLKKIMKLQPIVESTSDKAPKSAKRVRSVTKVKQSEPVNPIDDTHDTKRGLRPESLKKSVKKTSVKVIPEAHEEVISSSLPKSEKLKRMSKSKAVVVESGSISAHRDDSEATIDTSSTSVKSEKKQTMDALFESILSEKDKTKQKQLAIRALLDLYSGSIDESTINQYLDRLLPIAYPAHFKRNNNDKLIIVGESISMIHQALGLTFKAEPDNEVKLDCRQFDCEKLGDLKLTIPSDVALWAMLKSLKPIDKQFTVDQKIAECLDLIGEIRRSKVVPTGKLKHVWNIINYGAELAMQHTDTVSWMELRNLLSSPKVTEDSIAADLKAWINRKLKTNTSIKSISVSLMDDRTQSQTVVKSEREAIESWFNQQKTQVLTENQAPLQKLKIKLIHQVKELYVNELNFIGSMYELRDIVNSRLQSSEYELAEEDRKILEQYLDKVVSLLGFYEALRRELPIPSSDITVEKVLTQLPKLFTSEAFSNYQEMRMKLASFEEIQTINKKYALFLNIRFIYDTTIPMETRQYREIDSYTSKPSLFLPKLGVHLGEMEKAISESMTAAKKMDTKPLFSLNMAETIKASFKVATSFGTKSNREQTEKNGRNDAQKYLDNQLKLSHTDSTEPALKSILHLYTNSIYKGTDSDVYLSHYLRTLLAKAYPELFIENEGNLFLTSYNKGLLEALGETLSSKTGLNLDVGKFDPKKLSNLIITDPKNAGLWLILKSLIPISREFTVDDKVDACLEVASAISKKSVVKTEKLKYTLDVLSFAYDEANPYSVTLRSPVGVGQAMLQNLMLVEIKDSNLVYRVMDSSYQIRHGSIPFLLLNLSDEECEGLKSTDSQIVESQLKQLSKKILENTGQLGYTYEKGTAMDKISRVFAKNKEVESKDMVDVSALRAWVAREIATKQIKVPKSILPLFQSSGTTLPKESPEAESMSYLDSIWKYITTQFNKFIYDHFTSRKKSDPDDPATKDATSEPKEKPLSEEESEHSSDLVILNHLRKKNTKIDRTINRKQTHLEATAKVYEEDEELQQRMKQSVKK